MRTYQSYDAYGAKRSGGTLLTENQFTGQKLDDTGLYYFRARYYDPQISTFVSPDTLVPDATLVSDYNRYAYVRGNPLGYIDGNGHEPYPTDASRFAVAQHQGPSTRPIRRRGPMARGRLCHRD